MRTSQRLRGAAARAAALAAVWGLALLAAARADEPAPAGPAVPPQHRPTAAGGAAGPEAGAAPAPEPAAIQALIAELGADAYEQREEATRRLLELGPAAHPWLREALSHPDAEVRYRARYILRADLRQVLACLRQLAAQGRTLAGEPEHEQAFAQLLALGERAVGPLVQLLRAELLRREPDLGWAVLILTALERLGEPSAVEPLAELLALDLRSLHERLAHALRSGGAEAALAAVGARARAPEAETRRNAAVVLGLLGDPGAARPLVALVADPHPGVRMAALQALVRTRAPEAVPAARRLLADPDAGVQTAAILAAGALGLADAAPRIREAARAASPREEELLVAAVSALARLRDTQAEPLLLELLARPGTRVPIAAADALGWFRARAAVPGLVRLLERPEPALQAAALRALGRIGDPAAFEAVTGYYRRRGIYRPLALAAIARFRTPEAIAFLVERARATDDDTEVHIALDALVHRAPEAGLEVALSALRRRGSTLRARAARLLGRAPAAGRERALAALRELLEEEPSEEVRLAAVEALGTLGARELAGELQERLEREPAAVRRQILRTLAQLGQPEGLDGEIARLEAHLRRHPDDTSARGELGLDLLYRGRYAQAEQHLRGLLENEPRNRIAAYNLACARARAGREEAALAALEQAVTLGFRDWRHAEADPDLDGVRAAPGYRRLLARMRGLGRGGPYALTVPDGLEEGEEEWELPWGEPPGEGF
ncbi:MAG: hypothetical protein KatS3mg102_0519 [Planctomycetota bacterium]|nr:MAG: hypothetical protein KatS3mg102_0519 [Planctomycetota bacterium]